MDENGGAATRHPEHDRLREEVSSWYQTSVPGLGYHAEPRRFGVYRRHAEQPDSGLVIVKSVAPDEVPEFLADARRYFDSRPVVIWIDDKDLDAVLGPVLVAAGCAMEKANVHLAHVGARPERVERSGITVERVTADTVMDYALVKLKGFANSEGRAASRTSSRNWLFVGVNLQASADSSSRGSETSRQLSWVTTMATTD